MDKDSQELVTLSTEAAVKAFMSTAGAPLSEAGGWGADIIRRYRFKSTLKTAALAQKWLAEAGLEAHPVALKVLVPLLECASLEDEVEDAKEPREAEAMHERWAALLANAAAGDAGAEVLPSFPSILAELTPLEARILERLAQTDFGQLTLWMLEPLVGVADDDELARNRFLVHLGNLERQNLCTVARPSPDVNRLAKQLQTDHQRNVNAGMPRGSRTPLPSMETTVAISPLGQAFIAACKPPV